MNIIQHLTHAGIEYSNFTRADLLAAGVPEVAIDKAERATLTAAIDDAAAAIYARFDRFRGEYELRESQASAYKDANYQGSVPPQVAAFATPAGKSAKDATDLILAQATALRGALDQLGVLRMRKYEVLAAADTEQARAKADAILASIKAIAAAL